MNKKLLSAMALASVLLFGLNVSASANENVQGEISVNISEYKEVAPDTAMISFSIKTYDTKSIQKASELNKEISNKVVDMLNKTINTKNGDFIKTSSFNVVPVYSYSNSKKVFEKYEVSNNISVRTKSIDKIGNMIDNAVKSGVTNIDSLSFSSSNYDTNCDELISVATQKARKRADSVAKSLSASIYGFKNLNASCNANGNNSPRLLYTKNMIQDVVAESTQGLNTTISSGVIKINANVNAIFLAK